MLSDTHTNNTNKKTKDNRYSWLDIDGKRGIMSDREIIDWKVNL